MGWLVKIYKRIKKEGLNKQDITVMVRRSQQQLKDMEYEVELYNDFIRGQQLQKRYLEQEIDRLEDKKSRLNHPHYK
jgi:hypothetical protein